ncbi:hypothetical protein [Actinoplanes sp. NPDC049599]|uniref:hypothetical protein n=1 Tax=Actinoplanes sp. NPDC049599 TaxID=3363903 RepID=UPI0037BB4280
MSYQAVQWAFDIAPMLRMPSGKPDTTARGVLVARAERADENGIDTHAGVEEIIWRTGYDERTIQRAERRLEQAGLLVPDGTTRHGTPRWNLNLALCRDEAERAEIAAAVEGRKTANRDRERARRDRHRAERAHSASTRVDAENTREDSASTRAHLDSTRVDAAPPEPPMNHPGTTRGTTPEPPSGGTLPPDPLRPPSPPAPGTSPQKPLSEPPTPAQDHQGDPLPHAHADETATPLRLVATNDQPAAGGPPRGIFPIPVPGRRLSRAEEAIAAATARREAARRAFQGRETTG